MFKKKTIFLVLLIFLVSSCGNSWDSLKRGITGQKEKSTDEFLVRKKDPLILPPDFESLPLPEEQTVTMEKISSFEKTLKKTSSTNSISSEAGSAEMSILERIRKE